MARSRVVMLVLTGMLIAGPLALAVGLAAGHHKALEPRVSGVVQMASAPITGRVSYADGRTAVAGAPVRVWSGPQAAFVRKTTTGGDGRYRLPALKAGDYQLVFADRVRVRLHVTAPAASKENRLDVVIPHGEALFAQMPIEQKAAVLTALSVPTAQGEEPQPGESKSGLLPTLAIGAGGVTAVALLADWDHDHHGRRRVNSP